MKESNSSEGLGIALEKISELNYSRENMTFEESEQVHDLMPSPSPDNGASAAQKSTSRVNHRSRSGRPPAVKSQL